MVSAGMQILGAALGVIGWIGVIVVCALPMWRVTAFIGSNIVTSQIQWEGIWMNCVVQSTGQMQCKVYDSMLALSSDLQAARALTVISIVVGIFGILLAMAGGKCTNCVEDEKSKAKVAVAAGVVFIISGILCLIPVCWTAQTVIRDFYNPLVTQAQKRELGASLFIGWGTSALLIIGGALLCSSCPRDDTGGYTAKYSAPSRSQVYDSLLALPQDLQAARAMVIISIIVGIFGVLMAVIGGKCTNCMEDESAKAKACIVSGVIFIIAAFLILIPVSWSAQTLIRDFYNPLVLEAQRRELGASLYIGWGSAALLLLGGGLLCWNCPPKENQPYTAAKFAPARSLSPGMNYV
ncbi:claudin-4 isoform X2 [Pangasianodon hypophthalmus]|uniref:claudin-4 isoform X2 n=1 Tax=Pangasianodon hypophthalmus TaxID=310915 RepID=UPI0023081EE8|nr:claudin-4 isoform X2 [Pangasianodon hypophthalmus]